MYEDDVGAEVMVVQVVCCKKKPPAIGQKKEQFGCAPYG
jgi:hypothetical protein